MNMRFLISTSALFVAFISVACAQSVPTTQAPNTAVQKPASVEAQGTPYPDTNYTSGGQTAAAIVYPQVVKTDGSPPAIVKTRALVIWETLTKQGRFLGVYYDTADTLHQHPKDIHNLGLDVTVGPIDAKLDDENQIKVGGVFKDPIGDIWSKAKDNMEAAVKNDLNIPQTNPLPLANVPAGTIWEIQSLAMGQSYFGKTKDGAHRYDLNGGPYNRKTKIHIKRQADGSWVVDDVSSF